MSRISIAFGVTKEWLKYTYVTICSILSNANPDDEYKFYILCDTTDENFEEIYIKLKKVSSLNTEFDCEFIKMNNKDFDGVIHDTRVGVSASYRLKLSTLTKEDKIIYLDSDIIVLGNIAELWNYDIDDYLIGAVEDKYSELMTCHANLSDDDIYINSGVLVMNLKKFREKNLENLIFKKLRENETYSDQDVLNDVCRNKVLNLPLKYNLMLTTDDPNSFPKRKKEYAESLKSPVILHYAIKPWIIPVEHSEHWRKYYELLYNQ